MSWPLSTSQCIGLFFVNNGLLIVEIDWHREGKWAIKPN